MEKSEIADILNNHFELMFTKEFPEYDSRTNVNFGTERVLAKITCKSLLESKSMGTDQIHLMILKECALEFARLLAIIFRQSIK